MQISELFSCVCYGELRHRFQCPVSASKMDPMFEIEVYNWIAYQLYSPTILNEESDLSEHICDFLNYHCLAYKKRYNQTTNWAFVTTLEDWLVTIRDHYEDTLSHEREGEIQSIIERWCKEAYSHPTFELRIQLIESKSLSSVFMVTEDKPSNDNYFCFYSMFTKPTEYNIKIWLFGEFYSSVVRGYDLGNAVEKQKYLVAFLNYHLRQYNISNHLNSNESFVTEIILFLQQRRYIEDNLKYDLKGVFIDEKYKLRIDQLIINWCREKCPSFFVVKKEYAIEVNRFTTEWETKDLIMCYEKLIIGEFIDFNTSKDLFVFCMGGDKCDCAFKPIVWLKNIQLLREFVELLLKGKTIDAKIKEIVFSVFEKNGKPAKLAKNKVVFNLDSDLLKDLFSELANG